MASEESEALWCCEPCKMIGRGAEAIQHQLSTGHPTRRLTDTERDEIVAIWREEGRAVMTPFEDRSS